MRNSSTEEEKDTVESALCKQLYQMWECKFLKTLQIRTGVTRRSHARAWNLMKATVKATGGDDWEMLAPTNNGRVIRSVSSKAHKWNIQVTENRDELKVIYTNIMNIFIQNAEACYNRTTHEECYE